MAIITRLTRLLHADLHALLDRLEAPDLVLAQAVREMEQALDQERRRLLHMEREIARLTERETALQRLLEQAGTALDDCLAAGRDALARPVIRRRLETEQQSAALARRRAALDVERASLTQRLAAQGERLADLRARAALYDAREATESDEPTADWSRAEYGVRDTDVEVALLRAKRQRESAS